MTMAIDFRKLQVGDAVDLPTGRGIWASEWDPSWFIFTVPPRGELPASAWLSRNGVTECWHPTETAFKRTRFKPNLRIPYERPVAPGYLFVVLPQRPHWDVLFARARGKLLKVVSHQGEPVPIPETEMAKMKHLPQRLAAIREAEAAIREAEAAKRRINVGDKVSLQIGGIEWQVTVDRIHAGIASFIIPLLGGREVQVPVETLRKERGLV